jgi:hypothetical protein
MLVVSEPFDEPKPRSVCGTRTAASGTPEEAALIMTAEAFPGWWSS